MKATITNVFLTACLVFGVAGAANAATVTFSDIMSGSGAGTLFDEDTTVANGNDLNIGIIGFNADNATTVDSISLMVTAPAGYVITSIDYTEGGNGATQNGIATASGSVVVDNMPTNFQLAPPIGPNDAREWGITLDTILVDNKQSVAVSITNSLFSYAFDGSQAFIEKNDSTLTVGLTAVPLPAAAWLFGSALIALVGIQRRKAA